MSVAAYIKLIIYSFGLAFGQIMFKLVSQRIGTETTILSIIFQPLFIFAVSIYFGLTVIWMWLLTEIPLSKAYPFSFLSLLVVVIVAKFAFHEHVNGQFFVGLSFTICGLILVANS